MAITGAGRFMSLAETATNVVRVVARCATTDGGKWVGLVSDLARRSHSRRTTHMSGPSVYSAQTGQISDALRRRLIGGFTDSAPGFMAPISLAVEGHGTKGAGIPA